MLRTALIALAASTVAGGAIAADAGRSATTTAAPEAAWATVGDFCAIADWHPAVAKCDVADHAGTQRRTLTLGDGALIVEDLVARDEAGMSYTYRIVESPLPVADYESTIAVRPDGDGAKLEWTGTFEPAGASEDEAVEVMEGIYAAGLEGIVAKTE